MDKRSRYDAMALIIAGLNMNVNGPIRSTYILDTDLAQDFCYFLLRSSVISGYRTFRYGTSRNVRLPNIIEVDYAYAYDKKVFTGFAPCSTRGNRMYWTANHVEKICNAMYNGNFFVLRTSKGFMFSSEAVERRLGGEVIAYMIE